MGAELWIGFAAVFVSGGAIGAAGILLTQWIVRRVDGPPSPRRELEAAELDVLRSEVAELGRHMRNVDARLDFTERLLDGALPLAPPPARIADSDPPPGADAHEG